MHFSPWLYLFAAGGALVQSALLVAIFRYGRPAQWKSLICSLALDICSAPALAYYSHVHGHYRAYFLTFWGSSALQSILRVWLMIDVAKSFPGLDFLPKNFHRVVWSAAAIVATLTALYSYNQQPSTYQVVSSIVLFNRAVSVGWIAFATMLLAAIRILNFGWDEIGSAIARGIIFQIVSSAISASLMSSSHSGYLTAVSFDCLCNIAVFITWAHAFVRPSAPSPSEGELQRIQALKLPER